MRRYVGVPICNPNGETIGTVCFLDDRVEESITQEDERFLSLLAMRVSAEMERERITQSRIEESREQAKHLARLNQSLAAHAEEKRRFVSMVIHDLRHPLTTLRMVLHLLRTEEDPQERGYYLDMLDNRVFALATSLDELVTYDQIEAGKVQIRAEQVELEPLIRDCFGLFAQVPATAASLYCEIDSEIGVVLTDPMKVRHILLNLLANAVKYTPEGSITVRAYSEGSDFWVLEVDDTGIGIRQQLQTKVFEEFVTDAEPCTTAPPGGGLGLSIVRQLCDVLNAEILMHSTPGVGTCFQIRFPREYVPGTTNTPNESSIHDND